MSDTIWQFFKTEIQVHLKYTMIFTKDHFFSTCLSAILSKVIILPKLFVRDVFVNLLLFQSVKDYN